MQDHASSAKKRTFISEKLLSCSVKKGMASCSGIVIIAVLHTHAHFDHIMATPMVATEDTKVGLHKDDLFLWDNLAMQGKLFGMKVEPMQLQISDWLEDEKSYAIGDHRIKVIHTPGHTPGSCSFCLQTSDESWLFSGDTLFRGSIGRTDLWRGDHAKLLDSIENRLFNLEDETRVIPGHGPSSTIAFEKSSNPFFQ